MLSAEFHYSRDYIDWGMELAEIGACIRYHNDNPPAGKVILELVNAFLGDEDNSNNNRHRSSGSSKSEMVQSNSLEALVSCWTAAGGSMQ